MSVITSFEEIESWKTARKLTKEIYMMSQTGTLSKDWGLKDQMRRASVSAMANIAEGFGRRSDKEFMQFLTIARGSTEEVISHLYVAFDCKHIDEKEFLRLKALGIEVRNKIGGFIRYLESQT